MFHSNPWINAQEFEMNQASSLSEVTDIFKPAPIQKMTCAIPVKKIKQPPQNLYVPIIKTTKASQLLFETLGQRNDSKLRKSQIRREIYNDPEEIISSPSIFQMRQTFLPALPPPCPISFAKYPRAIIKIQEVRRKYKSLESVVKVEAEDMQKLIISTTVDHLKFIFPPIHPHNR